jgi:CP family cyanate transporter-like MFS transporter
VSTKRASLTLTFIALMIYALVLRPPVAAIGPLLPEISTSLGLNLSAQGLLTAIPVLSFGAGAFAGPMMSRRLGLDKSLLLLSVLIFVAVFIRGWFGFGSMLIGTIVAGLSIAVANVLLPSIVRLRFPKRIAQVTAAYTTILAISASVASATAVPLSQKVGGWNFALLVWASPALLAILLWWWQQPRGEGSLHVVALERHKPSKAVLKSPITWALFVFFGIQSLGFYATLAWLPSILISRGLSATDAGGILGLTAIIGVPVGIVLGFNFSKFKRLDGLGFAISSVTASGFVFLLIPGLHIVAAILLGLGMASTFPLSLNWISTRATTNSQTTQLSAITQGYGYLLSAVGTFVFGALSEITHSWTASILLMFGLTVIQAASSFVAGGKRQIPAD